MSVTHTPLSLRVSSITGHSDVFIFPDQDIGSIYINSERALISGLLRINSYCSIFISEDEKE